MSFQSLCPLSIGNLSISPALALALNFVLHAENVVCAQLCLPSPDVSIPGWGCGGCGGWGTVVGGAAVGAAVVAVVGGAAVVGGNDMVDGADVVGKAVVMGGANVVGGAGVVGGACVIGGLSVPGVVQSGQMNPGTQFTTNLTLKIIPAIAVPGVTTTVPGAPFNALYVLNISVSSTSESTPPLTVINRPRLIDQLLEILFLLVPCQLEMVQEWYQLHPPEPVPLVEYQQH